jgi:hypothetical protein
MREYVRTLDRGKLIWIGNNEGKSTNVTHWNFMVTERGDL